MLGDANAWVWSCGKTISPPAHYSQKNPVCWGPLKKDVTLALEAVGTRMKGQLFLVLPCLQIPMACSLREFPNPQQGVWVYPKRCKVMEKEGIHVLAWISSSFSLFESYPIYICYFGGWYIYCKCLHDILFLIRVGKAKECHLMNITHFFCLLSIVLSNDG